MRTAADDGWTGPRGCGCCRIEDEPVTKRPGFGYYCDACFTFPYRLDCLDCQMRLTEMWVGSPYYQPSDDLPLMDLVYKRLLDLCRISPLGSGSPIGAGIPAEEWHAILVTWGMVKP